jgi:hypothetical protein
MATVMMPNKPNIKERVRVCCPHPPFLPTVNFTEPALAISITGWAPHMHSWSNLIHQYKEIKILISKEEIIEALAQWFKSKIKIIKHSFNT